MAQEILQAVIKGEDGEVVVAGEEGEFEGVAGGGELGGGSQEGEDLIKLPHFNPQFGVLTLDPSSSGALESINHRNMSRLIS